MCHMDVPTVRLLYEIDLIEHLLPIVPTPMLPKLMSEALALFILPIRPSPRAPSLCLMRDGAD